MITDSLEGKLARKSGIPEHFIYKRILNRAQQVLWRENTHCGHVFILDTFPPTQEKAWQLY